MNIPINLIEPNPEQPRQIFEPALLTELAASIKENGVIQAITIQSNGNGRYILQDGDFRLE